MVGIILCVCFIIATVIVARILNDNDAPAAAAITAIVGIPAFLLLLHPLIAMMGGLMEGYSTGERAGYITKISQKGIIWKTNEGEMQIGQGKLSALQEPFRFSVSDDAVLAKVVAAQRSGELVILKYNEWIVMPFYVGESVYLITDVVALREDTEEK